MRWTRNLVIFLAVVTLPALGAIPVEAQPDPVDISESRDAPLASVTQEDVPGPWIPVDFNEWAVEGQPGGVWDRSADGTTATLANNVDGGFYLVSPETFAAVEVHGTMSVQSSADDDFLGFALGYKGPLEEEGDPPADYDSVTFWWKQGPVVGGAPEGLVLARMDNPPLPGGFYPASFEDGPGFEVLDADTGPGKGWTDFVEYDFKARYTDTEIEISIDDQVVLSATGAFEPGRIAVIGTSQAGAMYSNFEYRRLEDLTVEVNAGPDQKVAEGDAVQLAAAATVNGVTVSGSSSYSDVVLKDSPLSYWPFGEEQGSTAGDLVGPVDGSISGASWSTESAVQGSAGSLEFDGANDFVNLGNPPSLTPNEFTLETWIRVPGNFVPGSRILRSRNFAYNLAISSSGTIGLDHFPVCGSSAGRGGAASETGIADDEWHHVIATVSPEARRLYIDGVLGSTEAPGATTTGYCQNAMTFGRDGDRAADYFRGSMDQWAIYDRALTQAEIDTHYCTGRGTCLDPIASYLWELISATGPPVRLSSASVANPTFETTDDGVYTFRVSATVDGLTASDTVTVTVDNADPVISADITAAPSDGAVLLSGSLTDPGFFDTHEVSVDWGDGSVPSPTAVPVQGSGWGTFSLAHTYADAGTYDVAISLIDDDGGTASVVVPVVVAVGGAVRPVPGVAIWADDQAGSGARLAGRNMGVSGRVHSNTGLTVNDDGITVAGEVTVVGAVTETGRNHAVDSATQVSPLDPPVVFDLADYQPGGRAASAAGSAYTDLSAECAANAGEPLALSATQLDGLVWAPCALEIAGTGVSPAVPVTVVSDSSIRISGRGNDLGAPFIDNLSALAGGSGTDIEAPALRVSGADHSASGLMAAPNGLLRISGLDHSYTCGLLAGEVLLTGQGHSVTQDDCPASGGTAPDVAPVTAPALVVPALESDVSVSSPTVTPGEAVTFTGTISNPGSILVVPGLLQLVNTAGTTVTVNGATATLESRDASTQEWSAVTTATAAGTVDPSVGVVTDGGLPGTTVAAGGALTAAISAAFDITAADLAALMDPTVDGLRITVVTDTSGPVSQTLRLDPTLLASVRTSLAGTASLDATLAAAGTEPVPIVEPTFVPGASITETLGVTVPVVSRLEGESNDSFATRLEALDGSVLGAALSGTATADLGTFPIPGAFASSTVELPVIRAELAAPVSARQGDTVPVALTLTNTGSTDADLTAQISDSVTGPLTMAGLPATLAAGETVTGTATLQIAPDEAGNIVATADVSWIIGTQTVDLAPLSAPIRVLQPAALLVTEVWDVFGAPEGELIIRIDVRNTGDDPLTGVVLVDRPSTGQPPVAGSLTTTVGTGTEDADGVTVDIGTLGPNAAVLIEYRLNYAGLPISTREIVTQSTVSSVELADVVSDDPGVDGVDDPTVFPLVVVGDGTGGVVGWFGDPTLTGGIFTPAEGTVVTEPTPVGVDPTLIQVPDGRAVDTWTLVATPYSGNDATSIVVGSGNGPVPTGLGTFDPTAISNGLWRLELQMIDDTGQTGIVWTDVTVEGNLKLGRFALTYEDMNVNVGSIPIRVLRSYDTLDRNSTDDFGFGWDLQIADFDVRTNGPLGFAGWEQYSCGGGFIFVPLCLRSTRPHYVTITWPNGQVESFDFTPEGTSSFFPGQVIPEYSARNTRTTSALSPVSADQSAFYNRDTGLIYSGGFGGGPVYEPQRFNLTDRFGTIYLLDVDQGLIEAIDRNGNTVTITDDGVFSSQGPSIQFERDADGRVESATGPDGNAVSYTYDAAGDLVAAVDQNGESYGFTYNPDHYLTEIDDPGAGPNQILTYSPDGRLESVTDAEGNTTQIDVDVDARTEIVTSPDGLLTTISQFDDRGNAVTVDEVYDGQTFTSSFGFDDLDQVTQRTDPEGNTWTGVYDDKRNLTTFTDAEDNISTFTYDSFGLPLTVTDAETNTTLFDYDTAGNLTKITDARTGEQIFTYDNSGNQLTRTDQIGRTWTWTYDTADRVATATDPRSNTTTYGYDTQGRVASITAADGGVTGYSYDDVGNLTTVTDPLGRVTGYAYDERDRLTLMTDAAGFETVYTYDDNDRLTSRTDPTSRTWVYTYVFDRLETETAPDGGVTGYGYDGAGRMETRTDPLGRTTTYGYDGANRRTTMVTPIDDAGTATTITAFDGNGRAVSVTNAENESTVYGYDGLGRLVTRTDPLSRQTVFGFDEVGNWTTTTNANNETTTSGFDLANQLLSVTNALNETTGYTYDPAGNLATVTNPLSRVTGFASDEVNRQTAVTLPSGDISATVFDTAGQVLTATSAAGYTTAYTYDPRGLVETVSDELGNTTTSTYDNAGRRTGMTDARGNTTSYSFDPAGRLETETDPLGGTVVFAYDLAGQRTGVTDPNGATRTFGFDDGGRMNVATDALGRSTGYEFDAVGRQTGMTDGRGVTVNSVFDAAGQLIGQTSPNETRTYDYDPVGRVTEWSDQTGTTTQTFDGVGRLTQVAAPAGTVGYAYNDAGERVSMTQPEGTVTYIYDANGFQAGITDWRGDTITMTNDPDGRTVGVTRSNAVATVNGFDAAGRLTAIDHTGQGGVIDSFAYTLDPNGNRIGVTSGAGVESYTLDELNRLTDVSYPDATSEGFVYDAGSNRTSHIKIDGTTVGYTVDDTGQLVSDTDGTTYTYDASGNLTATSTGDSYGYDDFGRMTAATAGGVSQTYSYDAAGVRTDVDGTAQLWDRTGLPTLISAGADNYVHTGVGIARTGGDWALTDSIGSVRTTLDNAGTTTGSQSYTAFGEQLTGTGVFGFAGQQQDPTGLQHLRARQYAPGLGRFTAFDPVQPGTPGTGGYNLYAYAGSNPSTGTDPTGRMALTGSTIASRPAQVAAPAIAATGQATAGQLIAAWTGVAVGLLVAGTFVAAGCAKYCPSGSDGSTGDDQEEKVEPPSVTTPSPYASLAASYGVTEQQIEDCLANGRRSPACALLPAELVDLLAGVDRGDGRNLEGKFTGSGEYGNDYETQGLDEYESLTGQTVDRSQIGVRLPDGSIRFYDGLSMNSDGTYEGIEVKGGSASLTTGQRIFDGQVSPRTPAVGKLNGRPIQVTSVRVINVK